MYSYLNHKDELFTDKGQIGFLRVRDHVNKLLDKAGAVSMEKAITAGNLTTNWSNMACVDRLVELEEIEEITQNNVAGQHRVFVRPK